MSRNTLIIDPAFTWLESEVTHWLWNKVRPWNVDFDTFPDDWPKLFIENVSEDIQHREVTAVLDFSRPEKVLSNVALAQGIIDHTANKLRLIIPFFPVGTMERAVERWDIATAKSLAKILSTIWNGREGKTSLHFTDIHDVRIKDFFWDNVNVELHTWMHLVDTSDYDAICFPDKWAADRFWEYFKWKEIIICDKVRVWNEREITIKEWDPRWKRILLVDDLIQTWGTSIRTWEKLMELGAKWVNAYVTHGVFPNDSHEKVAAAFDKLIVSDSIPANIDRAKHLENMKVESIAPLITRVISEW